MIEFVTIKRILKVALYLPALLSITFQLSGQPQNEPIYKEIRLNPSDKSESRLSEIASSIRYVKLESPVHTYIPFSYKIIPHDDQIFILSADNSGDYLACFSSDGKFRFKIQRRGKGPGEYMSINDFLIDVLEKKVLILDEFSKKIIRFGLDGSFEDEASIPVRADKFGLLEQGGILLHAPQPTKIDEFDRSFNFYRINRSGVESGTPIIPKTLLLDYSTDGDIVKGAHGLLIRCGFRDTLFQLNPAGKITGGYSLNFASRQAEFLRKLKPLIGTKEANAFMNSFAGFTTIGNVLGLTDHLYLYLFTRISSEEVRHQSCFFNLKTGSVIQASGKLINDIDGVPLNGVPSSSYGDELIYIVHNDELTEAAKTETNPKFPIVFDKIKPLTESDNAVLAFVKLK